MGLTRAFPVTLVLKTLLPLPKQYFIDSCKINESPFDKEEQFTNNFPEQFIVIRGEYLVNHGLIPTEKKTCFVHTKKRFKITLVVMELCQPFATMMIQEILVIR